MEPIPAIQLRDFRSTYKYNTIVSRNREMEYDTDVSTDLLKFIFESRGVSEAVI